MADSIDQFVVSMDATVLEAMALIDRASLGLAFVADEEGRIVGTLSDGDLRRALLRGNSLESRCIKEALNPDFVSAEPEMGRSEVLDLMIALDIRHVPVLDGDGRLAAVHLMRELLGATTRPNWAVIMAGGRGQRLRPITEQIPKPMVKVAGRPVLERLVLHLVGWGVTKIFLSVNYLAEVIEDHFGGGGAFGCEIEYLREDTPLGSGGALHLLPERPQHPVLVMNGDLVTQANIGRMLDRHDCGGHAATMGLHAHSMKVPYGVVRTDGENIVELLEKPAERFLVNAGMYVISPELIDRVPENREFPITELFDEAIGRNESVGWYLIEEDWIDVGNHRDLGHARGQL